MTYLTWINLPYYLSIFSLLFFFSCRNEVQQEAPAQKKEVVASQKIENPKQRIVFFGNSLSAGYGLQDSKMGFVGLIEKKIDSLGLNYEVVNAGLSGETTSGGLNRIDWVLSDPVDIFVLELGGNDALRAIAPEIAMQNLQQIIDKVKDKYPKTKIVLAGMKAPTNMGNEYTDRFEAIYPKLVAKNDVALIPFLLEDVGGIAEMNLADRIHPNIEGHRIVAENVWAVMKEVLN